MKTQEKGIRHTAKTRRDAQQIARFIAAAWPGKLSRQELCDKINIPYHRCADLVVRLVAEGKIPKPPERRGRPPAVVDERLLARFIATAASGKLSRQELAEKARIPYGVCASLVARLVEQQKIPKPPDLRGRPLAVVDEALLARLVAGAVSGKLSRKELAENARMGYGACARLVRRLISQQRIPKPPDHRGQKFRKVDWVGVDWSMSDAVLASRLGCSRQRVYQVRTKLGIPAAPRHQPMPGILLKQFLETNRRRASKKTLRQIQAMSGTQLTVDTVQRYCRELGIPYAREPLKTDARYPKMNWALPDRDLARIWGVEAARIRSWRHRHGLPRSKWRFQSLRNRNDPLRRKLYRQQRRLAKRYHQRGKAVAAAASVRSGG